MYFYREKKERNGGEEVMLPLGVLNCLGYGKQYDVAVLAALNHLCSLNRDKTIK